MQKHSARTGNESLAVVHRDGMVELLPNLAADPGTMFSSDVRLAPSAAAVVHTHPSGCEWPSYADQAAQIATGLPWVIAPAEGRPFQWGGDTPAAHLINRPFRWGVTDCYGAVRDALRDIYAVELADYPREWQFWLKGAEFEKHAMGEGYAYVSSDPNDAIEMDLVFLRIHSGVYNHCGLVLSAGRFYHHPGTPRPFDDTTLARVEMLERYGRFPQGVYRRG